MSCSNIIPDSQIAINDVADFEKNAFIIKDELADHHFTADDIEIIIFKKNNMMCFRAPDTVSKIQRRMIMAKLNCEFEADGCNIETDEFLVTAEKNCSRISSLGKTILLCFIWSEVICPIVVLRDSAILMKLPM